MINNIKELQDYIIEQGRRFYSKFSDPLHKDTFDISSSGCTRERINLLKEKIPNIPESYIKCLEKLNLNGVSVGWFQVSPSGKKNPIDTVDSILKAYEEPFFPQEFLNKHHMYEVGFNDTDFVYVTAGTDRFKNGEILYVEEGDPFEPEDSQIHPLAENFEQFLILAGNANQLAREIKDDESNRKEKEEEFIKCMEILKVPQKYHKIWLRMI